MHNDVSCVFVRACVCVCVCVQLYHKANLDTKAVDMLQNAVSFCPSGIDDEFINLLSDLLITDKCYEETYKVGRACI